MEKEIDQLISIMKKLRAPDGCPWDREQSHESILKCLIEECYEFYDAVVSADSEKMAEELGDILLQVVFHAEMAEEAGRFTFDDVARLISEKLKRRHPHVFGGVEVSDSNDVIRNWDKIKIVEKGNESRISVLDGIPRALPAIQAAYMVQKKAAKVGFDWKKWEPVMGKVREELGELESEIQKEKLEKGRLKDEVGDLLFSVVNLARHLGVDPEEALTGTNKKFEQRFRGMEKAVKNDGRELTALSLDEMDVYWEREKNRLSK